MLVNFAECISPILLAFEKLQEHAKCELDDESEDEDSSDIPIYSSDPHTISFLRFCSKGFSRGGDEKNGCYGAFHTYCKSKVRIYTLLNLEEIGLIKYSSLVKLHFFIAKILGIFSKKFMEHPIGYKN